MKHDLRQPKISIIIPCYNHGNYIEETVASIDTIADKNLYEIIIVNDGSTDVHTNDVLTEMAKTENYLIIFQENAGVSAARNKALSQARGKYILPVDSDNAIDAQFVHKAIEILGENEEISIVYCDNHYSGKMTGIREAGAFNLQRLMLGNFIDNCSVYRKEMTDTIGGYDTNRTLQGIEDWDLWLRAAFNGYKFFYINEPLFTYRVLDNSVIHKLKNDKIKGSQNYDYLIEKYNYYFGPQYVDHYIMEKLEQSARGFAFKLFLKKYFPQKFADFVKKGKLRKYI